MTNKLYHNVEYVIVEVAMYRILKQNRIITVIGRRQNDFVSLIAI